MAPRFSPSFRDKTQARDADLVRRLGFARLVALTVSIISFTLLPLSGDLAQALAGPSPPPPM